ncbi:MAG: hypothetical protein ACREA9_13050 [Pyrinomonadaceae bacterium]
MTEDEMNELVDRRERSEVWDQVRTAFRLRKRPADPLVYQESPMADDVQRVLSGKDWGELTASDLQKIRLDLRFLRPAAFWYYFVAIARHSLIGEEPADDPGGWLVAALTPPASGPAPWFDELVVSLTPAERAAVSRFVRWYSDGESYLPHRDRLMALWLG